MPYSGEERRKEIGRYCDNHTKFCEDIAIIKTTVINLDRRINGSIGTIEKHIDNSRPRNIAIIGVAVSIFIFLFNMAVSLGESKKQIEINTKRWEKLETYKADK